jgi:hypothetical protein
MHQAEARMAEYGKVIADGFDLYAKDLIADDHDKSLLDAAKRRS